MIVLTINDVMPFGKYKDFPIEIMLKHDHTKQYLDWAIRTWKNVKFEGSESWDLYVPDAFASMGEDEARFFEWCYK